MKPVFFVILAIVLSASGCNGSRANGPTAATTPSSVDVTKSLPTNAPPLAATETAAAVSSVNPAAEHNLSRVWTFDTEPSQVPPKGFVFARTGDGAQGLWLVLADSGAPSGANVLAQLHSDDTDYRFPIAVANEPSLLDVSVSVRCKPVSGKVDQACGLVARFQDAKNYLLTRANALEDNVRLYTVRDGQRQQIASWSGKVTTNTWHLLKLDVKGDHSEISWDGHKVIDHHDKTFMSPGRIGVWTKADSVTYFDDLRVEPLP